MNIAEIAVGLDYHYSRKMGEFVHNGKGQVEALLHRKGAGGGWTVVLYDKRAQVVRKLRPAHLRRRVLVR